MAGDQARRRERRHLAAAAWSVRVEQPQRLGPHWPAALTGACPRGMALLGAGPPPRRQVRRPLPLLPLRRWPLSLPERRTVHLAAPASGAAGCAAAAADGAVTCCCFRLASSGPPRRQLARVRAWSDRGAGPLSGKGVAVGRRSRRKRHMASERGVWGTRWWAFLGIEIRCGQHGSGREKARLPPFSAHLDRPALPRSSSPAPTRPGIPPGTP